MDWEVLDQEEQCQGQVTEFEDEFIGTEVTTSHYIPKTDRVSCQNENCDTSFQYPSLRRPHHCRRCGEIFCRDCLQNKRRLNIMAQPDQHGVLCKVCPRCYDDRGFEREYVRRSRTSEFVKMRRKAKEEIKDLKVELKIETRRGSFEPICWKEQMKVDIMKETKRLLEGFKQSMDNLDTIAHIKQLTCHIKTPSWEKSTFWKLEKNTTTCRQCGVHLERRGHIKNCKVCSLAMCSSCAHRELLLYFDDERHPGRLTPAKIAIIRVKGSPEIEPKFSLLLHCCTQCKEEISRRQIEDAEWFVEKQKPLDFDAEFVKLDEELVRCRGNICKDMDRMSLAIDENDRVLIEQEEKDNSTRTTNNNVEIIKENLNKEIEFYLIHFAEVKSLISANSDKIQGRFSELVKNYLQARSEFYLETKSRLAMVMKR